MDFSSNMDAVNIGSIDLDTFGPLKKFLEDDTITDIDFNGQDLWTRNIYNQRHMANIPSVNKDWILSLAGRISDSVNKQFNKNESVLEAETEKLRITCVYESNSINGVAMCIRKTSERPRINYKQAIKDGYAPDFIINLLIHCILAKFNIVVCGEPGVGKTEFAKFLCSYIPDSEKVVTIEDCPEWHYKKNRPFADCIELKTSPNFDYQKALKTCMRLNPNRIMLSEVRSREAASLIECWSTGVKGVTTLHTDDVNKIPDRLLNMMQSDDAERLVNTVYDQVDIGILIRARSIMNDETGEEKMQRYVDQIAFFSRSNLVNHCEKIVQHGEFVPTASVPQSILTKFSYAGIQNPFEIPSVVKKQGGIE